MHVRRLVYRDSIYTTLVGDKSGRFVWKLRPSAHSTIFARFLCSDWKMIGSSDVELSIKPARPRVRS